MKVYLKDLTEGTNLFEFTKSAEELSLQGGELKCLAPVSANIEVYKTGQTLVVKGKVQTEISLECSRCLKRFDHDVSSDFELIYKRKTHEPEAELIDLSWYDLKVVEYDADYIDLGERVRETILLALPIKPLCSENCKGLCSVCGKDLNEGVCGCKKSFIDPRWRVLEKLKNTS